MVARKLALSGLVSLCVAALALAVACSPALALNGHVFSSSFGGLGSGAGELSSPAGVAVSGLTHDVYVADQGNRRVDEFSSSGAFIRAWGWGVADGLAKFETCTLTCQAGLSGSGPGEFTTPTFIAIDNSGGASAGDVYVGDLGDVSEPGKGWVSKFDASGDLVSGWGVDGQLDGSTAPSGRLGPIAGIAVNSGGTLFVLSEYSTIFEFAQDGSFTSESFIPGVKSNGLAVNAAGSLFAVDGVGHAAEYRGNGTKVGRVSTSSEVTGLAVEPVTGELYVVDQGVIDQYAFPDDGEVAEPDAAACPVVPEEGCSPTKSFGQGILEGATAIGLDPANGTVYVVNPQTGEVDSFVTLVIDGNWAADVTANSATLAANVNPLGLSTEYRLEYGPGTSYGSTVVGNVGSGYGDVPVSYHPQDLSPGTEYHYRIVVHNSLGTIASADRTFTTQSEGGELTLLDGRVWELVSPVDKNGGLLTKVPETLRGVAPDGTAITYQSEGPSMGEEPVGNRTEATQVLSVRGANGWHSQNITLPQSSVKPGESPGELLLGSGNYGLFSTDLSSALVLSGTATSLSPGGPERAFYFRNDATGSYTPLLTSVPPSEGQGTELSVIGATADLSHVMIESPLALTAGAIPGPGEGAGAISNLYEWHDGELQLVNVLPDGEQTHTFPGARIAGNQKGGGAAPRAFSSDGRWVAWTWGSSFSFEKTEPFNGLFVRDMVGKKTVKVGGPSALYQTMSSDGSRVFYLEGGDLYEYDTGTGVTGDLTADHGAGEASAGVQRAVTDVSEDGTYVYFVAKGALADGGVSGEDNLYLLHENNGVWSTTHVATLSKEDENSWYSEEGYGLKIEDVSSLVSPNGRYLAFMSNRPLTGYDNIDANSGQPDEEVYLYDAEANRLACASCDPTGARPVGVFDHGNLLSDERDVWGEISQGLGHNAKYGHWLAGNIPGWQGGGSPPVFQPRYLSDSGRLFFNSPDALVPQDTNGLEDVYEYEPVGAGDCAVGGVAFRERVNGCVDLVSSGTSSAESAFVEASENGDDVFFITTGRLSPEDDDTLYDVYDAHVCSVAAPCVTAAVSPPPCTTGDSCKAAPSPQPEIFGPAPSGTFSGIGNVIEEAKKATVKHKAKTKKHAKKKKKKVRKKGGKAGKVGKGGAGGASGKVRG